MPLRDFGDTSFMGTVRFSPPNWLLWGIGASLAWGVNATSQLLRVDGSIFDAAGAPLTTSKDIQMKAYDAPTGGSLLWTSSVYNTTVASGRFSLALDASSGSPNLAERLAERSASQAIYLQISIDSGTANGVMDAESIVLPRIRSKGTAFALAAVRADALAGVTATTAQFNFLAGVTNSVQNQLNAKLPLAGGTMTGALALSGAPTGSLDAATKAYVDAASGGSEFQNVRSYLTGVTTTWTAPAGVTRIKVEVCGGGGSGGGSSSSCSFGGGGGGSGAMAWGYYTVTPGNNYTVIVGAGGTAPAANASGVVGVAGGSSSFDGAIIAGGGGGGAIQLTSGTGGTPSGSANFYGQPGNQGQVVFTNGYWGFPGGTSPCGGIGGIPGVMYPAAIAGGPGSAPGGGGGGAGCYGQGAGGNGGTGRVIIWY